MSANPYAAPIVSQPLAAEPLPLEPNLSLAKSTVRWTLICGISAIPSFWGGLATGSTVIHISAMLAGILCFVCAYTAADVTFIHKATRRNSTLRKTLKIGYGTRLIASIFFPVGLFLDIWLGVVSISLVQLVVGEVLTPSRNAEAVFSGIHIFTSVFLTTLVQGLLLNIVLAGYMGVVYGLLSVWKRF
jgi:hypothetical protein